MRLGRPHGDRGERERRQLNFGNRDRAGRLLVTADLPAAAERGSLKNGSGDGEAKHRSGEDLKVLCERAFRVEGDKVSLNRLPDTDDPEFDAIALLLYAYRHLKGQGTVIVGDLLGALRVSGASFKGQASKVVARQKTLVAQTGVKRASRYTLTNKGQSYAEEVLRRLDL